MTKPSKTKRHPIVQRWLLGHNDAGGCIDDLEREIERLQLRFSEVALAKPPFIVGIAIRVLLNHVEPGWENCTQVVQAWLDGDLLPAPPEGEAK